MHNSTDRPLVILKWAKRALYVLLFISLMVVMGYWHIPFTFAFLGAVGALLYVGFLWTKEDLTEYWENHYRAGMDSGAGSRGKYREWKWAVINSVIKNIKDKTVLDVGCGDLQFLKSQKFNSYLGLDISPTIITQNRKKRPELNFGRHDVTTHNKQLGKFEVVLCMDLLFHIMEEGKFRQLLQNLNRWTGEYLFVVNWCKNPLKSQNDGAYQSFRDLNNYLDALPDLKLVDSFQRNANPYNMLYLFKREVSESTNSSRCTQVYIGAHK